MSFFLIWFPLLLCRFFSFVVLYDGFGCWVVNVILFSDLDYKRKKYSDDADSILNQLYQFLPNFFSNFFVFFCCHFKLNINWLHFTADNGYLRHFKRSLIYGLDLGSHFIFLLIILLQGLILRLKGDSHTYFNLCKLNFRVIDFSELQSFFSCSDFIKNILTYFIKLKKKPEKKNYPYNILSILNRFYNKISV